LASSMVTHVSPVLKEVYYIVSQTNPRQTANNVWSGGKRTPRTGDMHLNPNQILCVEDVGPNSKVAQLIARSRTLTPILRDSRPRLSAGRSPAALAKDSRKLRKNSPAWQYAR